MTKPTTSEPLWLRAWTQEDIEITALDHLLQPSEHVGHAENATHRIEQRRKYEREQFMGVDEPCQQCRKLETRIHFQRNENRRMQLECDRLNGLLQQAVKAERDRVLLIVSQVRNSMEGTTQLTGWITACEAIQERVRKLDQ